jgi:hypothetical protein
VLKAFLYGGSYLYESGQPVTIQNNKLRERFGVQFRLVAFNVFNQPNLTLTSLSVFPPTATLSIKAYQPRQRTRPVRSSMRGF